MNKVLRASKAGFPCTRNLWFSVNGTPESISTHSQRIFDVGNALEPVIVDWLRADGWNVEYNPGSQNADLEVTVPVNGGLLAGHPDCIISKGDIHNALVDIKTMNDRAFRFWKSQGTEKSKPQYVVQLHIYALGLMRLGRNVDKLGIVGVNKNNSEIHIDFFDFDQNTADNIIKNAETILNATDAPDTDSSADDWTCHYCEFADRCNHHKIVLPTQNVNSPLPSTDNSTIINAMAELLQAKELSKEASDLEKHAKEILKANVQDQGLPGIQGGGLIFSISERSTSRFDSSAFKNDYPDLARQYTKRSSYPVFNVCGVSPEA